MRLVNTFDRFILSDQTRTHINSENGITGKQKFKSNELSESYNILKQRLTGEKVQCCDT